MSESVKVLQECIELQKKKSQDYQNPNSNVTQAMHYRRGIDTLHDAIQGKIYRAQSLLESGGVPNFESLEDTYKDLINYGSFAVAWLRGGIPGQNISHNIFNKKIIEKTQIKEIECGTYTINGQKFNIYPKGTSGFFVLRFYVDDYMPNGKKHTQRAVLSGKNVHELYLFAERICFSLTPYQIRKEKEIMQLKKELKNNV